MNIGFAKRNVSALLLLPLCLSAAVPESHSMWHQPVSPCKGVEVRALAMETPRTMKAFIAKIDLSTPGVAFAATGRDPHWGEPMPDYTNRTVLIDTKRETTADFMMRCRAEGKPVVVAANASPWIPWDCSAAYRSEYGAFRWWNVSDGIEVSHGKSPEKGAFFVVYKDGKVDIAPSVPPSRTNDVAFAFCGFWLSMTNGAPVLSRRADRMPSPRTEFGLSADRKTLVILAVDGRQPGYSLGADGIDVCNILRDAGVTDAVGMDGGGSTTLVMYDKASGRPLTLNRPSDGHERRNALNIGIYFKHGVP